MREHINQGHINPHLFQATVQTFSHKQEADFLREQKLNGHSVQMDTSLQFLQQTYVNRKKTDSIVNQGADMTGHAWCTGKVPP